MVQWLRLQAPNGGGMGQSLDGEIKYCKRYGTAKKKKGYNVKVLRNTSSCASCTVRPNKPKHWSWELRKVYCKAIQKDEWLLLQKNQTPRRVSSKQFWRQVRQGWDWLLQTSWCRNSLFLQRSGKVRSWSFSNKTNVILCFATFYLYMNGILKITALRIRCPVYFRLYATLLTQSKSNRK